MADLVVSNLSKRYRIAGAGPGPRGWFGRARAALGRPTHDFWALRDVSFEVERGETFGIIGRNGAGKSTLLKILSRITAPTEGEVRIVGRLVALIELGSGFHPELTGRENVFLNGAILGMRRREVAAKLEQIVEFAGVREFIDVPVKWYSSGMYVRLGFAIAAHLDLDVLLVDEVLAVGDAAFQARCFSRIAELKRDGATVLVISHDLAAIERLCGRALLLDGGRMQRVGSPREVVGAYQRLVEGQPLEEAVGPAARDVEIAAIEILDAGRQPTHQGTTGGPLVVRVPYSAARPLRAPRFEVTFYSFEDGALQSQCVGTPRGRGELAPGEGAAEFEIGALGLQPGVYTLGATITEDRAPRPCAWIYGRSTLYVTDGPRVKGKFYMPFAFSLREPAPVGAWPQGQALGPGSRRPSSLSPDPRMRTEGQAPVSVVIPCHNQARYLPDAIESALGQDAGVPEVIVVDDGSTEPIAPIVARFPGVRLIVQPNQGVAAARNAGLRVSTRPYVVFLDADDRLTPDGLTIGLAALAEQPEAAGAVGLCRVIDPRGAPRPFRQQPPVEGNVYAALLRSNFVWMPAEGLFQRDAVERAGGFDPAVPAAADYDLYLRIARDRPLALHRAVVAEYRMHDENMSANGLLMLRSTLRVLERQWPYARRRPDLRAAYAEGNRFWRDFYGDRVVETIRSSLRTRGSRGQALTWALALLRIHPRAVVLHVYRKLRNTIRRQGGHR